MKAPKHTRSAPITQATAIPADAPPLKPPLAGDAVALEDAVLKEIAVIDDVLDADVVDAETGIVVDVALEEVLVAVASLLPEKAESTDDIEPIPVVRASEGMAVLSCLTTTRAFGAGASI